MNAKDMALEQYSVEPIHWSGALKAIILRFLTRKKLFFSKIFKILDFQKEFLLFFFTKCQCSHLFLIADIFKKYPLVLQAILPAILRHTHHRCSMPIVMSPETVVSEEINRNEFWWNKQLNVPDIKQHNFFMDDMDVSDPREKKLGP